MPRQPAPKDLEVPEPEFAFREAVAKVRRVDLVAILGRKIIVTPYAGHYDQPAGVVVAIEGSPPQGILLVPLYQRSFDCPVVWFDNARAVELRHGGYAAYRELAEATVAFLKSLGYPFGQEDLYRPTPAKFDVVEVPGRTHLL